MIPETGQTNPTPEVEQDWLFTFGADHTHPDTGQRLGRSFVRIHGTCDSTRDDMFTAFGNRWSHQYSSEEKAGVEKYGLTEVSMPFEGQVAEHGRRLAAEAGPVASVEERTEEQGLAELLDQFGDAVGRGHHPLAVAEHFAVHAERDGIRAEILRRFEGHSGGAAALRADVVTLDLQLELANLRTNLDDIAERLLPAESLAIFGSLDQIDRLTRGHR